RFCARPRRRSPQPPSPAGRDAGTAAEHHALLDAAPEDALGVAAEEVDGALRAEKSEHAGDAAAPAPELERGRGFFNRLKFGRSEPKSFEPQARQERMLEPSPHEPRPHEGFSEPMLESSFPLDDSHPPPDQDRYASTDAIDDEYAYEEADEDVAPRRRYGDLIKGLVAAAVVAVLVGIGVWQWPNMVALYRSFRAPAVDTARDVPPPAATRPKITDRIEPGSPQAPATAPPTHAAAPAPHHAGARPRRAEGGALRGGPRRPQRQTLRRFGDLAHRDRDARSGTAARACDSRRRRSAGAQARHDLVAAPQHRQGAARDSHGRDHVQAAGGFPLGRHLQRSRHPDEASRADARPALGRAAGQIDAWLLPHRPVQRGKRQGPQSSIAQGAELVRHPGGLQQQPPRHPRPGKRHARRARLRRCVQGVEAVAPLTSSPRKRGPIFQSWWLWVPNISAFTRVHSPSKTRVNALNDTVWAGRKVLTTRSCRLGCISAPVARGRSGAPPSPRGGSSPPAAPSRTRAPRSGARARATRRTRPPNP